MRGSTIMSSTYHSNVSQRCGRDSRRELSEDVIGLSVWALHLTPKVNPPYLAVSQWGPHLKWGHGQHRASAGNGFIGLERVLIPLLLLVRCPRAQLSREIAATHDPFYASVQNLRPVCSLTSFQAASEDRGQFLGHRVCPAVPAAWFSFGGGYPPSLRLPSFFPQHEPNVE